MVALNQREKQIVEQFQSLEPRRRRYVLLEMARASATDWKRFHEDGEARLREAARRKGRDWDQLDDQQRQDFVEELADGEAA